jgi:SAM-dependent methyltransferase
MDGAWPLSLERARMREGAPQGACSSAAEITDGLLRCSACGSSFPIVEGIPALMPPERFYRENCAYPDQTSERLKRDEQAATCEERLSPSYTRLEQSLTLKAMRLKPADVVLEVGAGTGRLTACLLGHCREIVAVDFSLGSLQYLAERLSGATRIGAHAPTLVHPVQADIRFLPLRSRAFSRVLAGETLHHLPGEAAQRGGLQQLARSVRPEGLVLVSAYNYPQPARGNGDRGRRMEREGFHAGGAIYYRRFEPEELVRLLQPFFRVEKLWGFYISRLDALGGLGLALNRVLAATRLGLRWGHYLMARCAVAEKDGGHENG